MTTLNQGLVIHKIDNHDGFYAHTLGLSKIKSHYHNFYHFINITKIELEYRKLLVDKFILDNNLSVNNQSIKPLLAILHINCLKIEENINKLKLRKRNKRGLVNIVGTAIKFIAGNPDANDAHKYEDNINSLFKNQEKIVKQMNKFTSFANHISSRYQQNIDVITSNIDKTNKEFSKLNNIIDLSIQIQYLIYSSNLILNILSDINEIIALAQNNIVSNKVCDSSEIEQIIDHLKLIYSSEELLPFSKFHLFQILSISKIELAIVNNAIVCILSVPILSTNTYNLKHIYPVPNSENKVLIPPAQYFLSNGIKHFWSEQRCILYEETNVCETTFEHVCNIINPTNCTFALAKNNYKLYKMLEDSTLLVDFKEKTSIIEQCANVKYFNIQNSNIIYSKENCKIVLDNNIFSTKVLNFSLEISYVQNFTHVPTKEINILNKHLLTVHELDKDLLPFINKSDYTYPIHYIFIFIIVLVTIILYALCFKKKARVYLNRLKQRRKTGEISAKTAEEMDMDILRVQ